MTESLAEVKGKLRGELALGSGFGKTVRETAARPGGTGHIARCGKRNAGERISAHLSEPLSIFYTITYIKLGCATQREQNANAICGTEMDASRSHKP